MPGNVDVSAVFILMGGMDHLYLFFPVLSAQLYAPMWSDVILLHRVSLMSVKGRALVMVKRDLEVLIGFVSDCNDVIYH